MKNIIYFIMASILSFGFSHSAIAENLFGEVNLSDKTLEDTIVAGSSELKDVKAKSLNISGSLDFNDLQVSEGVIISGEAEGKGLKCSTLTVSGSITGESIKVKGNTIISGELIAKHSHFRDMKISGEATLNNSKAGTILFEDPKRPGKLILKGKTIISGDIFFKSGEGEVHVEEDVIIQGNIKGAKIIKK